MEELKVQNQNDLKDPLILGKNDEEQNQEQDQQQNQDQYQEQEPKEQIIENNNNDEINDEIIQNSTTTLEKQPPHHHQVINEETQKPNISKTEEELKLEMESDLDNTIKSFKNFLESIKKLIKLPMIKFFLQENKYWGDVRGLIGRIESIFFSLLIIVSQLIFLIFFAIFSENEQNMANADSTVVSKLYGKYMDISVMIFVAFGLLLSPFRHMGKFTLISTFLAAVYAFELGILLVGGLHAIVHHASTIQIGLSLLIEGVFSATVVFISIGTILGKLNPTQSVILALLEVPAYVLNVYVCYTLLKVRDVGGSMVIHAFGGFFGLGLTISFTRRSQKKSVYNEPDKVQNLLSLAGMCILWVFWPSFNSILADEKSSHRVIVNTVLALIGCALGSFATSRLVRKHNKFDLEDLANSTLAGAVMIGTSAEFIFNPAFSIFIGFLAAVISVCCYAYVNEIFHKIGIHDTVGVTFLHAIPGFCGGFIGFLFIIYGSLTPAGYGTNYSTLFPRGNLQSVYNLIGLIVSVASSFIFGIASGFVLRYIFGETQKPHYNDIKYFEVEEEEEEFYLKKVQEIKENKKIENKNVEVNNNEVELNSNIETEEIEIVNDSE